MRIVDFADLYKKDYSIVRIVPCYHKWYDQNSWTTPEGGRPNSGLMFFADCETEYLIKDRPLFRAHRGEISYVPQKGVYSCRFLNCGTAVRSNEYLINFELFDADNQPFTLAGSVRVIHPRDSAWYLKQFEEILLLFHQSAAPISRIKALLFNLLTDLSLELRKEHFAIGRFAGISKGILHLEQHYAAEINIGDLAAMCHTSETSFRRLFKQYAGMSPLAYANWLRMSKARLLLESGAMSVSEVAASLGYDDPSYFSRLFKHKTGQLPKDMLRVK